MSSLRYFGGIRYGDFENLEVLVDPADNSLWITQPTIEKILGYEADNARKKLGAKTLKAFAGKDLMLGKTIKAVDVSGRKNTIKAVPFETFLILVHFEAFNGKDPHRKTAQGLLLAGFADSFSSLVLSQCGIQVSTEDRQQVVTFYRHWYHKFQDWVRDTHIEFHGQKPSAEYYRTMAVAINVHLFERTHFYCDRIKHAETDQLRVIENFQMAFLKTKGAKAKIDPLTAVLNYINVLESI